MTMSFNKIKVRNRFIFLLCVLVAYLFGILTQIYISPLVTNQSALNVPHTTKNINQIPSKEVPKQPSEKALNIAAFIYTNSTQNYQKTYKDKYASQSAEENKRADAIRGMAFYMDSDPAVLAGAEAWAEKYKAESSNPNNYVESPDIIVPKSNSVPTYTPPKSVNCTSNSIGSSTYTNCN